jgi:hypothetical protein
MDWDAEPFWRWWQGQLAASADEQAEAQRAGAQLRHYLARFGWEAKRWQAQQRHDQRRSQHRQGKR